MISNTNTNLLQESGKMGLTYVMVTFVVTLLILEPVAREWLFLFILEI